MQAQLKTRRRADYGFMVDYRTRWTDNDMYGHLNNAIYYFLFDSAINDYLIKSGAVSPPSNSSSSSTSNPRSSSSDPQIGLVARSQCDYFRPLQYPAIVDICVRVSSLGNSSVRYEVAAFQQGLEDVCAVAEVVHVFVSRDEMRPSQEGMSNDLKMALSKLLVVVPPVVKSRI